MKEFEFNSPEGMSETRQFLGLSIWEMARVLDMAPETIRRMESGGREVGPQVARLLRALYLDEHRVPLPGPMTGEMFGLFLEFLQIREEDFAALMGVDVEEVEFWKTATPNKVAVTAIRWLRDGWSPPELGDPESPTVS